MSVDEQIRNLMGRYIQAHDTHDVETIVNLFTEDGLFANQSASFAATLASGSSSTALDREPRLTAKAS